MMNTQTHFLSKDPDRAMQEMMDTIDTLKNVYIRETDVLIANDTKAFLALQEEKYNAAMHYQKGIEDILSRQEEMKMANPLLKRRLQEMQDHFSDLTKKNLDALHRMHRCAERLGTIIRDAAKDAVRKERTVNYGESGAIRSDDRKTVSMGVSETA
ncbi:MAG: hypothetical protein IT558_05630 [Alphaproteobacteria bacterium]|nr:hypothetical protein [Alphaproteobacteria bacterium]